LILPKGAKGCHLQQLFEQTTPTAGRSGNGVGVACWLEILLMGKAEQGEKSCGELHLVFLLFFCVLEERLRVTDANYTYANLLCH